MCGIVGYIGNKEAKSILLDCLGRLEYRGYDSAGIGMISEGKLFLRRCVGKNAELNALLKNSTMKGKVGIAHTRWATHGRPADVNAHPQTDCSHSIAVVHNGIIENYHSLKKQLENDGHKFVSQTDSEVLAHLLESVMENDLEIAVRKIIPHLNGAYALAVISEKDPYRILAARNGGVPLVIGHSNDGIFIASDITAVMHHTRNIQFIEDREIAVISRTESKIIRWDGSRVDREIVRVTWQMDAAEKGQYAHFMHKEIHEQPKAVMDTIKAQEIKNDGKILFPQVSQRISLNLEELGSIRRVSLVGCGTSWHAALVGKFLIEFIARVPVDVDIASEYRYRPQVDDRSNLLVGISQSGETADTLGALKEARNRKSRILSICNVVGSSMSRESEGVIYTHAGPEIGVASTKAFTTQLTALYMFAVALGRSNNKLSADEAIKLLANLRELPTLLEHVLAQESGIAKLSELFVDCTNALYLGRGIHFPLAIEGALKLKEISYIHAEGYAAGELKHGPIALIEKNLPVLVLAPMGRLYGKVVAAIEEVKARDGTVIVLASEGDSDIESRVENVFYLPKTSDLLTPIIAAVPLQLLAYYIALRRGCDVDKPRNLAKSVTVE